MARGAVKQTLAFCKSACFTAHMDALHRAIQRAGGQAALAKVVGVSPQAVGQWVNHRRPIPLRRAIEIEHWTGGEISRDELRPDIFGDRAA